MYDIVGQGRMLWALSWSQTRARPPRRRTIGGLGTLVLAFGFVTGCASDDIPVVRIVNHTDMVVDVLVVEVGATDGNVIGHDVKPGMEVAYDRLPRDECSPVQLVAKDPQGNEIARNVGPICRPSTWVIERTQQP